MGHQVLALEGELEKDFSYFYNIVLLKAQALYRYKNLIQKSSLNTSFSNNSFSLSEVVIFKAFILSLASLSSMPLRGQGVQVICFWNVDTLKFSQNLHAK